MATAMNIADGFALLRVWCQLIDSMPIDQWITDLGTAETVATVVDPTLMIKYMGSDYARESRALLEAAREFQRYVRKSRPRGAVRAATVDTHSDVQENEA